MNKNRFLALFKDPPSWLLAILYPLTAIAITSSILALTLPTFPVYLGYATYVLAAVCLSYTVYTVVRLSPLMKRGVLAWIRRHEFTRDLKDNFGYRTLIFSAVSFAISIAYGIFNGVLGILSLSIWYGALSAYYILLCLLRGGILLHRVRDTRSEAAPTTVQLRRAKSYRSCGILLLLLQMTLSVAIAQMIFHGRSFHYDMEWMVFAVAAYAFYKIITATVNFIKAQGQADLAVEAIRNINLADATVSILALQTALLGVYGTDDGALTSTFNTLTGSAVSLLTLSLGVFMIVKGQKRIKLLKTEQANGK